MDIAWQVRVVLGLECWLVHRGYSYLYEILGCAAGMQAIYEYCELVILGVMPYKIYNSHHECCLGVGVVLTLAVEMCFWYACFLCWACAG